MGLLGDILHGKKKVEDVKAKEVEECNEATMYNKIWLDNVVRETGFALTENEKRIENILKALNKRDGHCPCGGMTEEFICPCRMMREYGNCKCGLYQNFKDIDPSDTKTTGRIKDE